MFETIILLFTIGLLAIISPGPDLFLVLRNGSRYSRRAALCTVPGITLGIMVHITYCILGIGVVISNSIFLYTLIKWCGALYLITIGFKALLSKGTVEIPAAGIEAREGNCWQAFREGFLCNVTNPKVTLFMLSVFTQVIDPGTPLWQQLVFSSVFVFQTIFYFSFIVICMQLSIVRTTLGRISKVVDRAFGAILMGLGVRIAISD